MSSSTSSSSLSSHPPRTPLQERSNSDKNKLGIRLVPYSPPRLEGDAAESSSHGPATATTETGREGGRRVSNDPAITSPTRRKWPPAKEDEDAADATRSMSALSSPASSTTSLARGSTRAVSGTKLGPGSSGVAEPSTPTTPVRGRASHGSNISNLNAHDGQPQEHNDARSFSKSRRDNHIAVHADKTFSIVLRSTNQNPSRASDQTAVSSLRSSIPPSNYSTVSSHEGVSFDAADDDRASSALSSLPERSVSPYSPASLALTELPEDQSSSSPWNYRMRGGLRKVEKTPEPTANKGKDTKLVVSSHPGPASQLPTLPEAPSYSPTQVEQPSSPLTAKPSFNSQTSEQTDSTGDIANYKVLGRSSPPLPDSSSLPDPPSSSDSNYRLLGESSPVQPYDNTTSPHPLLDTPGSKNFIVHAGTSPVTSSLPATAQKPRPQYSDESLLLRGKYSQESLLVPPLNPLRRKSSEERVGYYKQRSRESLRRANSFSSISSVISQDTTSAFTGSNPNIVLLARTPSASSLQQAPWAGQSGALPQRPRMEPHPHVWSSQLSTVPSEDEGSDMGSRHMSVSTMSGLDRRSMSYNSRHSRQMMSISSSLAAGDEFSSGSGSRSGSRSDTSPYMMRGARELPAIPSRTVRDVDEHGDGLADLQELQHKGSRQRLAQLLSAKSSDRDLHSSASSRAGSLTSNSLPVWARIYYGSGERKLLRSPSFASFTDSSRPPSSRGGLSASPSFDQFPPQIFSPRRRAREVHHDHDDHIMSTHVSPARHNSIRLGVRKMTSSIWSPHLHTDRRASRLSMWVPPSITWSADKRPFGRRNVQILMFAFGFIFPFAWMIAAFLPLPPKVSLEMSERYHSTTQFGIPADPEPFMRQVGPVDDQKYQSARWWRNVNRIMSVFGLLVVGAIIALAIVGYWQNLARR